MGQLLAFFGGAMAVLVGAWRFWKAMRRTARQDALQEWIDLHERLEVDMGKLRERVKSLEDERDSLRHRLDEAMASTVELARLTAENVRLVAENANLQRQIEGLYRRINLSMGEAQP